MDAATQISTHHNVEENQFEIHDDGRLIGKADYLEVRDGQRVFFHTEVDDAYKGQGLAQRLAESALAETISEGGRIVPICGFIASYVAKHPQYADHVDEPTPEHRAAARAAESDA